MKISVQISSRHYFSILHVQAAALFAREAAAIEQAYSGNYEPEVWTRDQWYVIGSVVSSAAFLEALINEVFADAAERHSGAKSGLSDAEREILGDLWRLGVPRTARYSVLDKFRICLSLLRRHPFDEGSQSFQDVARLIKLRNALIHFEPETINHPSGTKTAQRDTHRMERLFRGKFPLNPIAGAGNPFWPDKCLGHGCAAWGVGATIIFGDEFFRRLGGTATYDHVRAQLTTA